MANVQINLPLGDVASSVATTAQNAGFTGRPPIFFRDDFTGWSLPAWLSLSSATSLTNSGQYSGLNGNGIGFGVIGTGTGTTTFTNAQQGYNSYWSAFSSVHAKFGIVLPALSNGTDRYTIAVGSFQTATGSPQGAPVFYLGYSDNVNSGKFTVNTFGNTGVDTGVTVTANDIWHVEYTVQNITGAGSYSIQWAIFKNNATTASATGNLTGVNNIQAPGGSVNGFAGAAILKSLGTTNYNLLIDYFEIAATLR